MLFNNIREYINFFSANLKAVREQEEIKAREAERAAMEAQIRAQFVADSIAKADARRRYRMSQQNSNN